MALRRGGFTAKPNNALTYPPAKASPSPGGQCSAPENTLEGEGSMVLSRTVRRRRRWSKALAGGGPSIPLPFQTQEKEPPLPAQGAISSP